VIRARFYLGTRPLSGNVRDDRMAVGWTVTLRRIDHVADLLAELHVAGATVTPSVGLWKGALEPSLVIELLGDYSEESARAIAERLREAHGQDTVLWTIEPIHSGSANRTDTKGHDDA